MSGSGDSASTPLTEEDRRQIAAWCDACLRHPGRLPDGVEPVQTRLIRQVGRGVLPSGAVAFVKVMAFPRAKDRLRYAFRKLPAEYEAEMLRSVQRREGAPPCPEVLHVEARRRFLLPGLSVLVTLGLDLAEDGEPVSFEEAVRTAARLADLGIEHPDLHQKNLLRLRSGELAILDLQSARVQSGPLSPTSRRMVATRLLEHLPERTEQSFEALVSLGLIDAEGLDEVRRTADRREAEHVWRRVARCLRVSTEFERLVGPGAIEHWRRGVRGEAMQSIEVGTEGRSLWIGDRAREILDSAEPLLVGYRHVWWRPARDCVYIAGAEASARLEALRAELLGGHERALAWRSRARCAGRGAPDAKS